MLNVGDAAVRCVARSRARASAVRAHVMVMVKVEPKTEAAVGAALRNIDEVRGLRSVGRIEGVIDRIVNLGASSGRPLRSSCRPSSNAEEAESGWRQVFGSKDQGGANP